MPVEPATFLIEDTTSETCAPSEKRNWREPSVPVRMKDCPCVSLPSWVTWEMVPSKASISRYAFCAWFAMAALPIWEFSFGDRAPVNPIATW